MRDADVRVDLLASLERRIPRTRLRRLVLVRQRRERERLVPDQKVDQAVFERLDAAQVIDALVRYHPMRFRVFHAARAAKWRREVRLIAQQRAQAASRNDCTRHWRLFPQSDAFRAHLHPSGFRANSMTEIVHQTGLADRSRAIRALKKAQDLLGDLHDRRELSDHLADEVSRAAASTGRHRPGGAGAPGNRYAEARQLHLRYAERRDRLMGVVLADSLRVGETRRLPSMVAVAAVVVVIRRAGGAAVAGCYAPAEPSHHPGRRWRGSFATSSLHTGCARRWRSGWQFPRETTAPRLHAGGAGGS